MPRSPFTPEMLAAMRRYSQMGEEFPPMNQVYGPPPAEGSLQAAAEASEPYPSLDEVYGEEFPPMDQVYGPEAGSLTGDIDPLEEVYFAPAPTYDIPGKRVSRLPSKLVEFSPSRIEEVRPEGSLPLAATGEDSYVLGDDVSGVPPEGDPDEALSQLAGAGRTFLDTFKSGAAAQQAAADEQARREPWDPRSTYGQRVGLAREESEFQRTADARLAAEEQNMARQAQMRQWALEGWRDGEMGRLQHEFDEYRKMEVDPGKAFGDRSFLENAMGVLGALFGSLAQFKTGRNPGMEIINRVVEQSIDAQRANIAKAGDQFQSSMNLYQINLANRQDEETAWHQTKAMLYEGLARQFGVEYQNRFADKELQQQSLEQYEALMQKAAESQRDAAMAAEKHIYGLAETEAQIRKTLADAGKTEVEIAKLMAELKAQGGGGGGVAPQKTGAGFANESQIFSHFGFDKPGEVPPSLGDPFKASGGGIVTEVITPGREGPESVFGTLRGKALLEDMEAVRKLREDSVSWNQLYRVYLSLERSMLEREVPWDDEAIKNKQLAAAAGLEELSKIKGAASESDWKLVQQAMGDALNPNAIRDMRDPESRRKVFETLRKTIDSRIDSALSTYSHTRAGKDGQIYEFRVRWQPPQVGVTPQGATNAEAKMSKRERRAALTGSSLEENLQGVDQVVAGATRALKRGDRNDIEKARQEVRSSLKELSKGSKAIEGAENEMIFFNPFGMGGEKAVEKRIEQIRTKMRTVKGDAEYDRLDAERLDLEAKLLLRRKNLKGDWRGKMKGSVGRLKSLMEQLDREASQRDYAEENVGKGVSQQSAQDLGML